jgi:uncharacterized protein YjeT (DUF2065 family)
MSTHAVKTAAAIVFGMAMFVNGIYMFVWPRAWIDNPFNSSWTTSIFSRKKEPSRMFEIEVRLFGGLLIAAVGWVIYDRFLSKMLK